MGEDISAHRFVLIGNKFKKVYCLVSAASEFQLRHALL